MKETYNPVTKSYLKTDDKGRIKGTATKLKETYEITLEYGSEYQKEMFSGMISSFLMMFEMQMKMRHKKNKVNFKLK